jgi:predicted O-methyltransferase YrrM
MAANSEFTFVDHNSFAMPNVIVPSGWLEHGPFAMWAVSRLMPHLFVELGTHNGFSYFCFAQSISNNNLETRMYAIDTWKGDEHAGFYGDEVFNKVAEVNVRDYSRNSYLLRETFDEGLYHFSDGSIDLLHIDGLHTYESVLHDFNSWLPKLSEVGIVLFHDISVRERGFGVFRLWEELSQKYPSFEFIHGNGLGILKVGKMATALDALFSADQELKSNIQRLYAALGNKVTLQFDLMNQKVQFEARLEGINSDLQSLSTFCESQQARIRDQTQSLSWRVTQPLRSTHRALKVFLRKM